MFVVHDLHVIRMPFETCDIRIGYLQRLAGAKDRDIGLGDGEFEVCRTAHLLSVGAARACCGRADRAPDFARGPDRQGQIGASHGISVVPPYRRLQLSGGCCNIEKRRMLELSVSTIDVERRPALTDRSRMIRVGRFALAMRRCEHTVRLQRHRPGIGERLGAGSRGDAYQRAYQQSYAGGCAAIRG